MTEPFDLLAFAAGRSRATDEVSLYMDENAANKASSFIKRNDKGDATGVTDLEAFEAAQADLKKSVVVIHLEGLIDGRVEEIRAEYNIKRGDEFEETVDETELNKYLTAVLAEMYQKSVDAEGNEATDKLTMEQWGQFRDNAPRSQWFKLLVAVRSLIFVASLIDESVDAGFLAKS